MNPQAILALIGDVYAQLSAAQDRTAELELELGARKPATEPSSSSRLQTAGD